MRQPLAKAALAAAAVAGGVGSHHAPGSPIPLRPGVVLTYAANDTWFQNDVSLWVEVRPDSAGSTRLRIDIADPDSGRTIEAARGADDLMTPGERLGARTLTWGIAQGDTAGIRPRTAMMVSRRVFQRWKTEGRAELRVVFFDRGDRTTASGQLAVSTRMPPAQPVLIDGTLRDLATIPVEGTLLNVLNGVAITTRLWVLDDSTAPWIVRSERDHPGRGRSEVVLHEVVTRAPAAASALEAALERRCRATAYGIYFRFGSARLEPASAGSIAEVAAILRRHPTWTMVVEGHTDSVGGTSANRLLSERRAAAVREALLQQPGVAADRIASTGLGSARPAAPNATIEGRARNRRVELTRKC